MENPVNGSLPESFAELDIGYEFPPANYELNSTIVSTYTEAVEASSEVIDVVPPLAIAAYALKAISQNFALPSGSIHANQEFEFFKQVSVGTCIDCRARVAQRISRAKMNMLVIELSAFDQSNEKILSGKATLILGN